MKNKFITRTGLKELAPKIKVVYTTVDDDVFYYDPDNNFRHNYNIPKHAKILLSVSRITEGKGYADKFQIFCKLLSESVDEWHWIVVGGGAYWKTFESLVESAGLAHRIHLVGPKPRNELRAFYSNADVFWLLSQLDESFGLVYLEAQACGCPVLARNRAGVVEAVSHGESGYLVDNANDCVEILTGNDLFKLNMHEFKSANKKAFDINAI